MIKDVTFWCDQKIDDMSREDLIVALKRLGGLYNDVLNERARRAEFYGKRPFELPGL